MSEMRKALSWLSMASLVMFVGPSLAANSTPSKVYDLKMCVGKFANLYATDDPLYNADPTVCATQQSQVSGEPTTIETFVQARVFNTTPPSTNFLAQISSIDLFVDVNWAVLNTTEMPVTVIDNSGKWSVDVTQRRHLKVSGLATIKPQSYATVQFWVDSTSCGDGRWNVNAYNGSSLSGDKFSPVKGFTTRLTSVACAQLACNQFVTGVQPQGQTGNPTALGYILKLERGTNQDGTSGSACSNLFAYQTPNLTSSPEYMTTLWDKFQDDSHVAVFSYELNLEPTASTTAAQKLSEIKLAWLLKQDGTPDFQNALFCEAKAPSLPVQYTTLVSDNGRTITVASSAGVAAIAPPFSIVVEQERMLVTKVNTNTNVWTVTRSTGGTSLPAEPYLLGTPVMSTPFPIVQTGSGYPQSYVNKVAPICVKAISPVGTEPTNQFTTIIIDGSDGFVRIGTN